MNLAAYFLLPMLVFVLFLLLQAFLSDKKRKWYTGMILPSVFFLLSLIRFTFILLWGNIILENTVMENIVSVIARLFIFNILTISMLGIYCFRRCNLKTWMKSLIVVFIIGIYPVSMMQSDGGTTVYFSIVYKIEFSHSFDNKSPSGYDTRTNVHVFPFNWFDTMN